MCHLCQAWGRFKGVSQLWKGLPPSDCRGCWDNSLAMCLGAQHACVKAYGCPATFWPRFPSAAVSKGSRDCRTFLLALKQPLILVTAEFISPGIVWSVWLCLWVHNVLKSHQVLFKLLSSQPYHICNLHGLIIPFWFSTGLRLCACDDIVSSSFCTRGGVFWNSGIILQRGKAEECSCVWFSLPVLRGFSHTHTPAKKKGKSSNLPTRLLNVFLELMFVFG